MEASEYIKRLQAPRKGSRNLLVCIKALRDPTEDDIQSLRFRRGVIDSQQEEDELLEEDIEGDALMRDIELDLMEESNTLTDGNLDDDSRIPPLWTPDRILGNLVFDATESFGTDGNDTATLRNMTMGKFWKRPLESFLSRLADDWEKSQPPHLRHLAIVKDTMVTQDKKYAHYLYRTHANFEKAADAGDVDWKNVSKEAQATAKQPSKKQGVDILLDAWGFKPINTKKLDRQTGAADLADCRRGIVHAREYGQRWDNALWDDLGLKKAMLPRRASQFPGPSRTKKSKGKVPVSPSNGTTSFEASPLQPKRKALVPVPLLTSEQRAALGLSLKGRLGATVEEHIREHRRKTGDPTSIPESILRASSETATTSSTTTLLTSEEREARGIPKVGRLTKALEEQIRQEKGLTDGTPVRKRRKPTEKRKGPLLTPAQRKAKGLAPSGRLPERIVAELRRLESAGLDPFSIVLPLPDDHESNAEETSLNDSIQSTNLADSITTASLSALPDARSSQSSASQVLLPQVVIDATTPLLTVPQKRVGDETSVQSLPPSKRLRLPSSTSQDHEAGQSTDLSSLPDVSAPAKRKLGSVDENLTMPLKKMRTDTGDKSVLASKNSRQSSSDAKQLIGRRHFNITIPGIYFDADATRSIGQGRPRKAYMAIIKSTHLHGFAWFKEDVNDTSPVKFNSSSWQAYMLAEPRPSDLTSKVIYDNEHHESIPHPSEERICMDLEPHSNTIPLNDDTSMIEDTPKHLPSSPSPLASVTSSTPLQHAQEQIVPTNDASEQQLDESPDTSSQQPHKSADSESSQHLGSSPSSLVNMQQGSVSVGSVLTDKPTEHARSLKGFSLEQSSTVQSPEQSQQLQPKDSIGTQTIDEEPTVILPAAESAAADIPTKEVPSHVSMINKTIQPRVSPAGWVAINSQSIVRSSEYQSPYTSLSAQPTSPGTVHNDTPGLLEDDSTQSPATSKLPASAQLAFTDPRLDSTQSGYRPRRTTDRNVSLSKGNVFNARTTVIRHIIELCDGVFPLNGEIVYVYTEVWKERAPKNMACPERSTIIRTLRDMINDPAHKLVRYSFEFLSHTGNIAKRALVAYSHLAVTSPDVQKAYQGIRAAHPYRYFPPGIVRYVRDVPKRRTHAVVEVVENAKLPDTPSAAARILEQRIRAANKERERNALRRQEVSTKERQERNRLVEDVKSGGRIGRPESQPQRTRLVGLHATDCSKPSIDKTHWPQELANPTSKPSKSAILVDTDHGGNGKKARSVSGTLRAANPFPSLYNDGSISEANNSHDIDVDSDQREDTNDEAEAEEDDSETAAKESAEKITGSIAMYGAHELFTNPTICFYASNGTFSTDFYYSPTEKQERSTATMNSRGEIAKQVKVAAEKSGRRSRKTRSTKHASAPGFGEEKFEPTLVERLTGLTGKSDEPDYHPPSKKQRTFPTWEERKERKNRAQPKKEEKYAENLDALQSSRKLFYTFVVASCMSSEEGGVNWDIIKNVYEDRRFDLKKTKKTWYWMRVNMAKQLDMVTKNFQTTFLKAYEEGKVDSIDDPGVYDWSKLVRWAMRHCHYSLPPLPREREALGDYTIDLSDHQVLNRSSWYKNDLAALVRSHNLLGYAFAAPLHAEGNNSVPHADKEVKARSWIRANIATPKAIYNKHMAHDKLRVLGESTLAGVVQDLVNSRLLRMWKIKRLRPGRNYDFAPGFARKYRRVFELKDFMNAVQVKKELDNAFASNRAFTISRTAEDGAVMAMLSLVNDDRIRLVPKLPPTNNELGAPHPRISVWGFSEGEYVHSAIDRSSLFWEVQAIPTESYIYGNPLRSGCIPPDTNKASITWERLPEPPLPSRDDPDALLPIWSTINGGHINYPWWYRILNLVVQSIMFQPGVTATDIFSHCPPQTTELFEIQLVLNWLEKVSAVKKHTRGTYEVKAGFWAAFGDRLIDEENDAFGEKVKRKGKTKMVEPTWRTEYNLRFSNLQKINNAAIQDNNASSDDEVSSDEDNNKWKSPMLRQVMQNSRSQYSIAKKALHPPLPTEAHTVDDHGTSVTSVGDIDGRDKLRAKQNQDEYATMVTLSSRDREAGAIQIASTAVNVDNGGISFPESTPNIGRESGSGPSPIEIGSDDEGMDLDADGESDDDYMVED